MSSKSLCFDTMMVNSSLLPFPFYFSWETCVLTTFPALIYFLLDSFNQCNYLSEFISYSGLVFSNVTCSYW